MKKLLLIFLVTLMSLMTVNAFTKHYPQGVTNIICWNGDVYATTPTDMMKKEDCSYGNGCQSGYDSSGEKYWACGTPPETFDADQVFSKYVSYYCDKNRIYGVKKNGETVLTKDCGSPPNECFINPNDGYGGCVQRKMENTVWCSDTSIQSNTNGNFVGSCRHDSQCRQGETMFTTKEECSQHNIDAYQQVYSTYCKRYEDRKLGIESECFGPIYEDCPPQFVKVNDCYTHEEQKYLDKLEFEKFKQQHGGGSLGNTVGRQSSDFLTSLFGGGLDGLTNYFETSSIVGVVVGFIAILIVIILVVLSIPIVIALLRFMLRLALK